MRCRGWAAPCGPQEIGLLSLAAALSELGVERLADVEELSDQDLQSVGIRILQRKRLSDDEGK